MFYTFSVQSWVCFINLAWSCWYWNVAFIKKCKNQDVPIGFISSLWCIRRVKFRAINIIDIVVGKQPSNIHNIWVNMEFWLLKGILWHCLLFIMTFKGKTWPLVLSVFNVWVPPWSNYIIHKKQKCKLCKCHAKLLWHN